MSESEKQLSKTKYFMTKKLNTIAGLLEMLRYELEYDESCLSYHTIIKDEMEFFKTKLYQYSELYFHLTKNES